MRCSGYKGNKSLSQFSTNKTCKAANSQIQISKRVSSSATQYKTPLRNAMKILSLLILFVVFFRETRHQLPIHILLANEEFIVAPEHLNENSDSSSSSEVNLQEQEAGTHTEAADPLVNPDSIRNTDANVKIEDDTKESSPPLKSKSSSCKREGLPVVEIPPEINPVPTERSSIDPGHSKYVKDESEFESLSNPIHTLEPVAQIKLNNSVESELSGFEEVEGNGSQAVVVATTTEKIIQGGEDEEPIPSYMEWAQKKQQELISSSVGQNGHSSSSPLINNGGTNGQSGQGSGSNHQPIGNRNGSSAPSTIDAKNFASPDCGAKVVQSNSEAQNPGGVLSSSHDEYMLNKCGVRIWFVIELCEPLTVEKISLGNLELFSSSPKEIELGISDRYPTRDWANLGPFMLPDSRAIHPVILPSANSSTFGKFVKVTILSHYGSEHYCPVSVVRVNGKSEYEVLESETTHQEDRNKEESALYEEQLEDQARMNNADGKSVGGLKDAVLNMLNKAVQSIVRRGLTSGTSETEQNDLSLKSKCRSVLQCVPRSQTDEQEIYTFLSCNSSDLLPFLSAMSPWCGWDYCHSIFSRQSIGLPWQPEGFFAALFGGPSVLHALCHFNKPLTDGCDPTSFSGNGNNSIVDPNLSLPEVGDGHINESITAENGSPIITPLNQSGVLPPQPLSQQQNEPQSAPIGGTTDNAFEQQIDLPPQSPATPSPGSASQETQIPPPGVTHGDESIQSHQQQSQQSGGSQQKESVFVRLTNRIKNLERNQSLTASYLEELSRRFKKQNEDNSILSESNKKILNDTKIRLRQLDDFYRQELQSLRRNLDDVRERLFTVQLQRSLLVLLCFSLTIVLIGGTVWIVRRFSHIQSQLTSRIEDSSITIGSSSQPLINKENSKTKWQIGRKRSNSDVTLSSIPDKSKKLKKKSKKNVADLKLITNLADPDTPITCQSAQPLHIPKSNSTEYFAMPSLHSTSSSSALTTKENIDPHISKNITFHVPTSPITFSNVNNGTTSNFAVPISSEQRPQSLLTKVDSPFTLHSSSLSPFLDSGVSTSGRFALLASPGPESPVKFRSLIDDSSSMSSKASSSLASTSSENKRTIKSIAITNGHFNPPSPSPTNGKKSGKKVGLKASFMPKIFGR